MDSLRAALEQDFIVMFFVSISRKAQVQYFWRNGEHSLKRLSVPSPNVLITTSLKLTCKVQAG